MLVKSEHGVVEQIFVEDVFASQDLDDIGLVLSVSLEKLL
jgi:hypothetical protein